MKSLSSITSIEQYVGAFSGDLADKVRQQSEPLHTPTPENRAWPLKYMATTLFPQQQDLVTANIKVLDKARLASLSCEMGTGKAQPNHCLVLTRYGWVPIGSIRVGDCVCTPDGQTAMVTGVFPQGRKEVKRVTFTDGSSTLCCNEHLWEVNTPTRKHAGRPAVVKSLGQLVQSGLKQKNGNLKYYIPITKPVYTHPPGGPCTLSDPYLLGYLIGNGCLVRNVEVCIPDKETVGRLEEIIRHQNDRWPPGYNPVQLYLDGGDIDYRITTGKSGGRENPLTRDLRNAGLMGCHSNTKFIPRSALFNVPAYRESLLQGLLDSDGSVEDGCNSIEYSTASSQLCRDVIALVQSLGGVATFTTKIPTFTYKGVKKKGMVSYRIMICLPPWVTPFRLSRKASRYKPRTKYQPTRGMMKVEDAGQYECTCIRLDSKEQLYITDDYIVTHNTPQAIAIAHSHACMKGREPSPRISPDFAAKLRAEGATGEDIKELDDTPAAPWPAYRAVVLCPPHLVKKWASEIVKFLGRGPRVTILTKWDQFLELRYQGKATGPEWYIMAMTTAKLGYDRRAAAIPRTVKVITDTGPAWVQGLVCPRCEYPARNRKGLLASKTDIEKNWLKCCGKWCKSCGRSYQHDNKVCPNPKCGADLAPCGEPLWQAKSHKIAPVQYMKAKGIRWFDYFIRDEAHESKGSDSIDGNTTACFSAHSKYTIFLTGTLLAGKSEDIRPLYFRAKPRPFINLGYGWKDEIPFAQQYGRIQTVVRTSEGGTARRSGKGSSKSTTQSVKPGIMPQLFPDFVANYTSFMSLTELATNLPSYHEETVMVPMEGIMAAEYQQMKDTTLGVFRSLYASNRKMAVKLLGPMLEAFLTWPDVPYDRKPIGFTDENDEYVTVYQPADLDRTLLYPKEKALIEFIQREKLLRRKCWIYAVRDDTRDRLKGLLESHGFKVAALSTSISPIDRLEWIAKHGPSCDVGLCHPQLVETGIELFGAGHNFPTLLWYSTGFRLNTLRQASRRAWRIGQPLDCKTVYFYYGESAQHTAIGVMAAKLVAAEAIEGKFSDGGLADESVDDDVALAVARAMADGITVKVESKYKPVEAASTEADRLTIMRNKMAATAARLRSYRLARSK